MGQDGTGGDGSGWPGMGQDGLGGAKTGWDGMSLDGLGRVRTSLDGLDRLGQENQKVQDRTCKESQVKECLIRTYICYLKINKFKKCNGCYWCLHSSDFIQ